MSCEQAPFRSPTNSLMVDKRFDVHGQSEGACPVPPIAVEVRLLACPGCTLAQVIVDLQAPAKLPAGDRLSLVCQLMWR